MSRKFWTPYAALIGNYSANQNVTQFRYIAGSWSEGPLIVTALPGSNLISMSIGAATIGNARCLKTAYNNGAVVPFTCTNGVWTAGTPVAMPGGGNPASVSVSLDGMHALCGADWRSAVDAFKFNPSTNLWEQNGSANIPELHTLSVAITPDGLRGIVCTKWGSTAYPLARNPSTDVWSAGTGIPIGSATTRYFACSMDPTGTVCLIGSNANGVNGDALFWNGSTWTRASVPFVFGISRWLADGVTVLLGSGNTSGRWVKIVDYNPSTKTFSLRQTVTVGGGDADLFGISVPELGRQDIAIATLFYSNQILPLSSTNGVWSAGTPVYSSNLSWPLASVIMPLV